MMRILISFLLLMTSFVIAQENCRIESVPDWSKIKPLSQDNYIPWGRDCSDINWNFSGWCRVTSSLVKDNNGSYYYGGEGGYLSNYWGWDSSKGTSQLSSYPTSYSVGSGRVPIVEKEICDNPEPSKSAQELFDSWNNCNSGKSSMIHIGSVSQVKWFGDRPSSKIYCDEPPINDLIYFDNWDDWANGVNPKLPDFDSDPLDSIDKKDKVPCFGNVSDCSGGLPPDYVDPNTGIPCWGDNCDSSKPPDYVDPNTGTPCWGDNCDSSKPPIGSGNNHDNGSNNGNGSGTGTGTGQGDGGIGWGDGNGSGNWDVPGGGWVSSETFDIPKTFWEQQNNETIKDKYNREIKTQNPYDFTSINTDIGVGTCPKFETELFGDVSPPCSFWELLGDMFVFLSTLSAFTIVFWRR